MGFAECTRMRSSLAFACALLLSTACGGEDPGSTIDADVIDAAVVTPDAIPLSCPAERPSLDDCFVGDAFADCGGTGDAPILACRMLSDWRECRWFAGGCVATGYEPSPCPPDDVCCRDNFPFDVVLGND